MKDLIIPRNTIQFLQDHGISAKKRYGQNFLIEPRVLKKIIEGAGITKEDTVLEIGPGIGTMTQALCEAAGRVIAVEIDRDMIPLLEENLAGYDNYEIINDDILKVDLGALAEQAFAENAGRFKVVANLPYYITTPIIMGLLEQKPPLESITVMVQKEVAERMQAQPGTKDYGALTLAVQYYTEAEIIANVPSNCFIPRPNVDSAVIRLTLHEERPVQPQDETKMFRVIRASFAQRRKTFVNGLKNDPVLQAEGIDRERIEAAFSQMGLDPNVRGERLTLEEFARLSDIL
jgi:16S rRNA (adenine1518-N6/adenine1519-N6)-dimethyltransferase